MSGTPRCCNTLRSTPLGNLDPVIRLFEGIFLTASANLIRNREFHVDYLGHAQVGVRGLGTTNRLVRSVELAGATPLPTLSRTGKTGRGRPLCGSNASLQRIHFRRHWTGVR